MLKPPTGPRRLYSIYEVQHLLGGIARSSVYNLINAGDLLKVNVGDRAFIPAESLNAYLAKITARATSESA